ncbi:DUF4339 domain-containing protein [Formicincola oecophyllae]|uniref:DUF4339 domain-containing protein n=1 Tax=Formicincola oecophyllae TaxID=2558361 RepID=UPI00143D0607|nr:DUF4339 domain-containing protein [Formicincola oecophyllae]
MSAVEWFYEKNGQPAGPVTRTDLIKLILLRRIGPQTLVWHPEFGNEWRPAALAGLIGAGPLTESQTERAEQRAGTAKSGLNSLPGVKGLSTLGLKKPDATPLNTLSGKVVRDVPSTWAWVLMALMALVTVINLHDLVHVYSTLQYEPSLVSLLIGFLLFVIRIVAVQQDRMVLAQQGVRPPSLWWFLFLPGYFWVRAKALGGRGQGFFWGCVGFYAVYGVMAWLWVYSILPNLGAKGESQQEQQTISGPAPHSESHWPALLVNPFNHTQVEKAPKAQLMPSKPALQHETAPDDKLIEL